MAERPVKSFTAAEELADRQRVELHEGDWVWLAELAMNEPKPVCEIGLDPAAVVKLFDFRLLHADRIIKWRDQQAQHVHRFLATISPCISVFLPAYFLCMCPFIFQ